MKGTMIKPEESSLPMTEETVRITNSELLSIISFFLILMFVFCDENCTATRSLLTVSQSFHARIYYFGPWQY
jgi:hypothetical protein